VKEAELGTFLNGHEPKNYLSAQFFSGKICLFEWFYITMAKSRCLDTLFLKTGIQRDTFQYCKAGRPLLTRQTRRVMRGFHTTRNHRSFFICFASLSK